MSTPTSTENREWDPTMEQHVEALRTQLLNTYEDLSGVALSLREALDDLIEGRKPSAQVGLRDAADQIPDIVAKLRAIGVKAEELAQ